MTGMTSGGESILSEDSLESLNASDKKKPFPLDLIVSFSPNDWVEAMNNDLLNRSAKLRLAEACKDRPEFFPVAARLLEQNGFGVALAREILEVGSWQRYQEIIGEYGINAAGTKEEKINALGKLLVSKKLLFWSLGIVFSKSAVRGFLSLFRDSDSEVRLAALEAIETYDIALSESALIMALDDTERKLRTRALAALKAKLPEARLMSIIQQDLQQTRKVGEAAKKARETIISAGLNLPGLKQLLPHLKSLGDNTSAIVTDGAAFVGSAVSSTASSVSTSVNSAFKRLTRQTSTSTCESPESLFALYVALAWADGAIHDTERQALNNLIMAKSVDPKFQKWLDEQPDLRELAPFLKKLSRPQESFDGICESLGVDFGKIETNSWLTFLEALLGIQRKPISNGE
jgi:hypothetical protein